MTKTIEEILDDLNPEDRAIVMMTIAERKQAEEALKESDEIKDKMISNISDVIGIIGADGVMKYKSSNITKYFGWSPFDLIGTDGWDTVHPDDLIRIQQEFSMLLSEDNISKTVEYNYKCKDGNYKMIALTAINLINDPQINGILLNYHDITDRKKTEEALKESEERLKLAIKGGKLGIWDYYPQTGLANFEENWLNMLGYEKGDIEQHVRGWNSLIHPDDKPKILENLNAHFNDSNFVYEVEMRLKEKSGEYKWILGKGEVLQRDENGKPVRMLGTHLDISKKKKIEKILQESEKRYRSVIDSMIEGLCVHEVVYDQSGKAIDYRILTTNSAYGKILGLDTGNATGKLATDFYQVESAPFLDEYEEVAKTGKPIVFEQYFPPMNKYFQISVFSPEEGQFATIFQDITERKQAEKAVIESQRLGAIGEMASGVAHDFNNSLQSIFGNLELALLEEDMSVPIRQYLETIKTSASDAATRVKILQRFGGKKKSNSEYDSININTLVKDIILQSRPLWKDQIEKNGLEISINQTLGEVTNVLGNDGELRSVIYNLVKNSVEAMPDGGELSFETGKHEQGVYITITDTGMGMNAETTTRVFQPFYTTKGFELGRGLGMAGAYSIIKEHKGDIYIKRTAPGEGTSIEIMLPYSKEEVKSVNATIVEYEGSAMVLWVEDEEMIRNLGRMQLKRLGHKGDVTSSGQEALEYLSKNEYDLVITDVGMPGMSGWQLADQIKEKYQGEMKVAVITGWGDEIDESEKEKHGVGYILGKPVDIAQLRNLIGEVMQMKKK